MTDTTTTQTSTTTTTEPKSTRPAPKQTVRNDLLRIASSVRAGLRVDQAGGDC